MKSSLLMLAALLMLATPAAAMSVDHDSAYAGASGASRFSDPDDALGGDDQSGSNQFGSVHFGSSDGSGVSFGMFGGSSNGISNSTPGYAMQSCLSAACQH
jgi:hypothetical protein